ncbi:MAG: aldo/keto reductase [Candidatus Heimdallarchaeota archaeon]|nr:aldo/keto reductase [Candidatus Heimdallarchaeota archaeon]
MHYRTLGKTGIKTSILGFGAMRLPITNPEDPSSINEELAIKIIRQGIDGGINYIDSAYVYHREQSEVLVGKALKGGYREKVTIQTKSPLRMINAPEDFDRFLGQELERLQVKTIDIYLLHGLKKDTYENKVLKFDILEKAKLAKKTGKIKYLGFSSHDKNENVIELLDTNEFESILLQRNILDENYTEAINHAGKKGIGVCVMGPVAGGRLALEPPKNLADCLTPGKETFTDLAFKFVWSNPNVSVALSGMNSEQMVAENLAFAAANEITLNSEEKIRVEKISQTYKQLSDLICTQCGYCMPCEQDVNITQILKQLIHWQVYGWDKAKEYYNAIGESPIFPGKNSTACVECGDCEDKCPQGIHIIENLKEAHRILAEKEE